jgi:GR25 family glycosyltransferase involved in LPS biosynthesis
MINEYFDKIYCINLDKRPNRWKDAQEEFKKHNLTVERFSGIVGNPNNIPTKIVPGHVGCVLSHYSIIKKASEEGLNQILILEDDAVFSEDLQPQFENYVKQVPKDWDMLYFGGNHNNEPLQKITENVYKIHKTYTTHAYAVKKSVFPVVIKMFPKLNHEVDVMYSILQNSFECFVFKPHLAWQRNGYSDILERDVNYDFLKHGNTLA